MAIDEKLTLLQRLMGASQIYCSTVNGVLERLLEEAGGTQLALSQLELLMLIAQEQYRLKVSDVADFLDVSNAAASRAIERLVQRELVNRTVAPDNRRAVDLTLTDGGRALLDQFQARRDEEIGRLLGSYPNEKLREVTRALDELSVLLLDLEEAAEKQCLRCDVHFRRGCVLREVLGRECETRTQLLETAREPEE